MIKEVNRMTVDPKEWLSDHIYKIDNTGRLISVEDDSAEVA